MEWGFRGKKGSEKGFLEGVLRKGVREGTSKAETRLPGVRPRWRAPYIHRVQETVCLQTIISKKKKKGFASDVASKWALEGTSDAKSLGFLCVPLCRGAFVAASGGTPNKKMGCVEVSSKMVVTVFLTSLVNCLGGHRSLRALLSGNPRAGPWWKRLFCGLLFRSLLNQGLVHTRVWHRKQKCPFPGVFSLFQQVRRFKGDFKNPCQTPVCTELQLKRFPTYFWATVFSQFLQPDFS